MKELLTTFQLSDNPMAQCMGCSPTYGHGTYTITVKQDPPIHFGTAGLFFQQGSSTDCIQTQAGQPQQRRYSSRL